MSHVAEVYYVMIASPSDIPEARQSAYEALTRWNESHTASRHVVLVPLRWETGSVPVLGDHPQAIINGQLVDNADIVIALFGSRLGRATPDDVSGTAEEIRRAEQAGKPVHLYFSTAPHPNDVDAEQLDALRAFQRQVEGLYGTFLSPLELSTYIWQAIEHDLRDLAPQDEKPANPVTDLLAQPGMERLPRTDSKGKLRYETKRWVDITNRGSADAENLYVAPQSGGLSIGIRSDATVIHAGQSRRFPMTVSWGAGDPAIKVTWEDNGEPREKIFHVG
jgi:hypothetical protein